MSRSVELLRSRLSRENESLVIYLLCTADERCYGGDQAVDRLLSGLDVDINSELDSRFGGDRSDYHRLTGIDEIGTPAQQTDQIFHR